MNAALYNLEIDRGGALDFTLRILDSVDEPVIVVGGETAFAAEIREGHRKPLVAALTVAPISLEDPDGTLRFSLTGDQTLDLDPSKSYEWDFFWTDTSGKRQKMLYGKVSVKSNITHIS